MNEFLRSFWCEGRRKAILPFKDDKPKDAENSSFEASSVLVVKAKV